MQAMLAFPLNYLFEDEQLTPGSVIRLDDAMSCTINARE
jgi:hypothetical protein